jgi:glyoxylase-like metal-dependent hydrolase (beta-lactamase superfamily II)
MFVVTPAGVIATDPMNPKAAAIMMREIRKVTKLPVRYVIYSHEHWDHVRGGGVFEKAGATFVSHAKCVPEFKRNPNPSVVMPTKTYSGDRGKVTLGGVAVDLYYYGPSHGACMTVMHLPKHRLAFIVDIVTPNRVGFRGLPDFAPQGLVDTLKKVEQLDFTRFIPGHGPPTAPKSAVTSQREYFQDLMAAVKAARKKTLNLAKVKQMVKLPKYEKWAFYRQWLPMNVERIYLYYHMGK